MNDDDDDARLLCRVYGNIARQVFCKINRPVPSNGPAQLLCYPLFDFEYWSSMGPYLSNGRVTVPEVVRSRDYDVMMTS